jgi:hypothetical protein
VAKPFAPLCAVASPFGASLHWPCWGCC